MSLFGDISVKKEKKSKKTIMGHDLYEAVSSLIKAMRLGRFSDSWFWAVVLYKTDMWYLGKRLMVFAGEDICPDALQEYNAVMLTARALMAKEASINNLWVCVYTCCKAPKFFERETALDEEDLFWGVLDMVNEGCWTLEHESYAIDLHTARGRKLGKKADCRYSGSPEGRSFMIKQYKEMGKVGDFPSRSKWRKIDNGKDIEG